MKLKDFRKSAWNSLSGNWGMAVLVFFILVILQGLVTFKIILISADPTIMLIFNIIGIITGIISIIVTGPFMLSAAHISISFADEDYVEVSDVFYGFKYFSKSISLLLLNALFTALWTLLLIVPGIIKGISYSMSYFVMRDNPELSANEARIRSAEMMDGYKLDYFLLSLSFIGWILLSVLTLGILLLWVIPYINVTTAKFYQYINPDGRKYDEYYDGEDE